MAKRLTKDSPHYVNNKEFTAALDAYSRKCRAAIEADEPRPVMSRYLGDCIIRMSTDVKNVILNLKETKHNTM